MTAAASFGLMLQTPLWLGLLPMLAVLLWRRHRRRPGVISAAAALVDGDLVRALGLPPLPPSPRQRLLRWLPALEAAVLTLLVLALSRPIERLPLPPQREGASVLLCLDRSSSMQATDLGGGRTRLQVAIAAATEFVRGRGVDRAGLVTFARYPDLRCPPTLDHAAAIERLGAVQPVTADGPEDATAIGTAVTFAVEALQRAATAGRVIVLLTDGEENVATNATPREIAPLHAAQLAAALGVRVHCIVVGKGQPDGRGGFVPLDTAAVQQLARATGGRFFAARDAATLRAIYRDIDTLEKEKFVEPRVLVRELYPFCLLPALLLAGLLGLGASARRGVLP